MSSGIYLTTNNNAGVYIGIPIFLTGLFLFGYSLFFCSIFILSTNMYIIYLCLKKNKQSVIIPPISRTGETDSRSSKEIIKQQNLNQSLVQIKDLLEMDMNDNE
jgi:hypothetical protein